MFSLWSLIENLCSPTCFFVSNEVYKFFMAFLVIFLQMISSLVYCFNWPAKVKTVLCFYEQHLQCINDTFLQVQVELILSCDLYVLVKYCWVCPVERYLWARNRNDFDEDKSDCLLHSYIKWVIGEFTLAHMIVTQHVWFEVYRFIWELLIYSLSQIWIEVFR